MIYSEEFDVHINEWNGPDDVPFYFTLEEEKKISFTQMKVTASDLSIEDYYPVVNYLYGRLVISSTSYFAEVVGYHHSLTPHLTTYHIIKIFDPVFYDRYDIDDSCTDICMADTIEFL